MINRIFLFTGAVALALFGVGCSTTSDFTDTGGHPVRKSSKSRLQTVRTTAYTHTEADSLKYGRKNAMGTNLRYGNVRSAAADWSRFPVGTAFKIKGQPHVYVIDDYGSALVGTNTIDIYKPNKGAMNNWGVRHVPIEIIRWGSYERSMHILKDRVHHRHCRRMFDDLRRKA